MEAAVKVSFLLFLFGNCQAGVIPAFSRYYQTSNLQSYFQYPQSYGTYTPFYYDYRSYPDLSSYPSTYYPSTLPVYSYSGFPMTYGYYPIPIYDFQINIVRVVPDDKRTRPVKPKSDSKPEIATTTTTTTSPRGITEIDLSGEEMFDEDTIEKLDAKLIPETNSEEIIFNKSTEVESVTDEVDTNIEIK